MIKLFSSNTGSELFSQAILEKLVEIN